MTPVKFFPVTPLPNGIPLSGGSGKIAPGTAAVIEVKWSPTAIESHDLDIVFQHDASGPPLTVNVTAQATTWRPEQIIDLGSVRSRAARPSGSTCECRRANAK